MQLDRQASPSDAMAQDDVIEIDRKTSLSIPMRNNGIRAAAALLRQRSRRRQCVETHTAAMRKNPLRNRNPRSKTFSNAVNDSHCD